jgi:SNF family Na+-dependent transporter
MVMMVFLGFPLLVLELAIGQKWSNSPLTLYGNAAPMFAGKL